MNNAIFGENLVPTIKHGGGGVMIWKCLAAMGLGHHTFTELVMNSSIDLTILEIIVRSPVHATEQWSKALQQNYWIAEKTIKVFEWPSQKPHQYAVNINEIKWGCKAEWKLLQDDVRDS